MLLEHLHRSLRSNKPPNRGPSVCANRSGGWNISKLGSSALRVPVSGSSSGRQRMALAFPDADVEARRSSGDGDMGRHSA